MTFTPPWAKPPPVRTVEQHEAMRLVLQFWTYANLCHCGNTHLMMRALLDGLEIHSEPGHGDDDQRKRAQQWVSANLFAAYALDAWHLTEHGSSVYTSWLTPSGIRLRDALRTLGPDASLDFDGWAKVEYELYPDGRPGQPEDGHHEGEWVIEWP